MAGVVIPFRGPDGKSRLSPLGEAKDELALAMLADVLEAAAPVGPATVAAGGGGQGAAVAAELERRPRGPILVVNADLPCATARDLFALLGSAPPGGMALVEAADGTTNVLVLSSPEQFADLYGPRSAERFRARAEGLGVECAGATIPNLVDDVDTFEDLEQLDGRLGRHTAAVLSTLKAGALP